MGAADFFARGEAGFGVEELGFEARRAGRLLDLLRGVTASIVNGNDDGFLASLRDSSMMAIGTGDLRPRLSSGVAARLSAGESS